MDDDRRFDPALPGSDVGVRSWGDLPDAGRSKAERMFEGFVGAAQLLLNEKHGYRHPLHGLDLEQYVDKLAKLAVKLYANVHSKAVPRCTEDTALIHRSIEGHRERVARLEGAAAELDRDLEVEAELMQHAEKAAENAESVQIRLLEFLGCLHRLQEVARERELMDPATNPRGFLLSGRLSVTKAHHTFNVVWMPDGNVMNKQELTIENGRVRKGKTWNFAGVQGESVFTSARPGNGPKTPRKAYVPPKGRNQAYYETPTADNPAPEEELPPVELWHDALHRILGLWANRMRDSRTTRHLQDAVSHLQQDLVIWINRRIEDEIGPAIKVLLDLKAAEWAVWNESRKLESEIEEKKRAVEAAKKEVDAAARDIEDFLSLEDALMPLLRFMRDYQHKNHKGGSLVAGMVSVTIAQLKAPGSVAHERPMFLVCWNEPQGDVPFPGNDNKKFDNSVGVFMFESDRYAEGDRFEF